MLTFHPLLTQPRNKETSQTPEESRTGETTTPGGVVVPTVTNGAAGVASGEVGEVREEEADAEFSQLLDDSTEKADGLTFDLLDHHDYHGNEAGLELGL